MGDRYHRRLLPELRRSNPQSDDDTQRTATPDSEFGDKTESVVQAIIQHSHLPKLEELEYISWDREAGTISKGPEWAEIVPFVQLLHDHSDGLSVEWL